MADYLTFEYFASLFQMHRSSCIAWRNCLQNFRYYDIYAYSSMLYRI